MGTRKSDGTWKDSCLDKLKPGEPFFVLRAQDRLSATLVRLWVEFASMHGCPAPKLNEAIDTAKEMDKWPVRKFPD